MLERLGGTWGNSLSGPQQRLLASHKRVRNFNFNLDNEIPPIETDNFNVNNSQLLNSTEVEIRDGEMMDSEENFIDNNVYLSQQQFDQVIESRAQELAQAKIMQEIRRVSSSENKSKDAEKSKSVVKDRYSQVLGGKVGETYPEGNLNSNGGKLKSILSSNNNSMKNNNRIINKGIGGSTRANGNNLKFR